mmetsp:Transcript_49186/g.148038  ORF Transcript_49186/g.148038 Transcript_49186/m.148038 type:complete len:305 (+) Transcript_49186:829-1743(+)
MRQIRAACANVRSKYIRPIALVVNTAGQLDVFIGDSVRITPDVNGESPDRGKENLNVRPGDELRVHPVRHPKNRLTKHRLCAPEPPRNFWQVPDGFNGRLGDDGLSRWHQDLPIRLQPPRSNGLTALRQVNVSLGHSDRGADVETFVEVSRVAISSEMPEGVDGTDLLGIGPCLVRSDFDYGRSQFQIGHVFGIQLPGSNRKASVNTVRAGVRPDGITLGHVADGTNDRSTNHGVGMSPRNWNRVDTKGIGVRREIHVVKVGDFWHRDSIVILLFLLLFANVTGAQCAIGWLYCAHLEGARALL